MKKAPSQYTSIGGQAVIEGVMMRSPHFVAVAVRKPNNQIVVRNRPYRGIATRFPFLKKPLLRGVVTLLESMAQGVEALSYSANQAVEVGETQSSEKDNTLSNLAIAGSMFVAFALGMGLFVALPHFLTVLAMSKLGGDVGAQSPGFHLIDGTLKMLILVAYIYLIAQMKDIQRVFQYHGAEHKSIYAFEAGDELTVANARKYTTLHPRCGTSFLLFLVLISVVVFSAVFPLLKLTTLSSVPILNHVLMVLLKIVLMFPVAGIAYELIKMSAAHLDHAFFKALMWPGLLLQNLTTKEPTDDQLEVALASLRQVLLAEKSSVGQLVSEREIEITALEDLGVIRADVAEFPEL
jgi:uncharacterized protein YqhQ